MCVELLITGTHKGPLRYGLGQATPKKETGSSIPPKGKRIELRACVVYKVEQGEISESHIYYDQFSLMNQLGRVP